MRLMDQRGLSAPDGLGGGGHRLLLKTVLSDPYVDVALVGGRASRGTGRSSAVRAEVPVPGTPRYRTTSRRR